MAKAEGRAVWTRVSTVAGQTLDLLHARVAEPYAPHVHEEFAVGVCTEGTEVIRYLGALRYSGPGSVVMARAPRFCEPVVIDPVLADGLRRVHVALSRGTAEPLEAESRLVW